jgi:hypothetical protein
MIVEKPIPYITYGQRIEQRLHVVVGSGPRAGSIKSIPYSRQFAVSQWFDVDPRDPDGYSVALKRSWRKQGYRFLRDMYAEEENTPDGEVPEGYKVFSEYCEAASKGQVDATSEGCTVCPGFPDELLPKAVIDLAKQRGPIGGKWQPPARPKPSTTSKQGHAK